MTLLPSFIVSVMRHEAEQIRRSADYNRATIHESGTTQESDCRWDDSCRKYREAKVIDHAADHFKAMWC